VHRALLAPSALTGASNFFELAVAAAISLFGFESGVALATVVGVMIEVPVMLSVVKIVNATRSWYEGGAAVQGTQWKLCFDPCDCELLLCNPLAAPPVRFERRNLSDNCGQRIVEVVWNGLMTYVVVYHDLCQRKRVRLVAGRQPRD
jgi:hypothetical protein